MYYLFKGETFKLTYPVGSNVDLTMPWKFSTFVAMSNTRHCCTICHNRLQFIRELCSAILNCRQHRPCFRSYIATLSTLQRFAVIYFKADHPLAEIAQTLNIMKLTFHLTCRTICQHWIPPMVFEDLAVNLQRTPPHRVIYEIANLERINANDITTSLTETLNYLLNAREQLPNDFVTLRSFFPIVRCIF